MFDNEGHWIDDPLMVVNANPDFSGLGMKPIHKKKKVTMKQKNLNFWHIPLGIVMAVAFLALLMCSCKTIEYVPIVEHETHHDSIYFTKVQKDSVWLHDSISIEAKGDTVRIEKWHTKYVTKIDTVVKYKSVTDSIPVPYEVPKYIEKPLKWHQKLFMWLGILAFIAVTLFCARWVSKHGPFV